MVFNSLQHPKDLSYMTGFLKWGLGISEYFEMCPAIKGDTVFKFNVGHLE